MPTYAEIAGKLMIDAATFFRSLAEQNQALQAQMLENATVFEQMATLLTQDPTGSLEGTTHGGLAGNLLVDAAGFFRTLAANNEPIREQMEENANVYEQIGAMVKVDPLGILD